MVEVKKVEQYSNLKIKGRKGTWYAVHVYWYEGEAFLRLESEQYGEDAENIIVNMHTMEEPSEDFSYHLLYGLE